MNIELFKQYALQFVGLPYIWGGDDPIIGFDCSGLAQELLLAFGGHPSPHEDLTAQSLHDLLSKPNSGAQHKSQQIGALAFYGKSYDRISHVAIVVGPNLILEAGGGRSSTVSPGVAAKQNAYIRIRPLDRRSDLITTILPTYKS